MVSLSPKSDASPSTLAELVDKMSKKGYAFNFDVTLEFNTPELQVGSVRVRGHLESAPSVKK